MEGEEYGFCTEFIIRLSKHGALNFDENSMREELATIGNSIVCVRDDDIVKVHVHTLEPAKAVRMGRRHGTFLKLKAENMQEQHDNLIAQEEAPVQERKPYAIITVAAGEGLKNMFLDLRADHVISGGQTMKYHHGGAAGRVRL